MAISKNTIKRIMLHKSVIHSLRYKDFMIFYRITMIKLENINILGN